MDLEAFQNWLLPMENYSLYIRNLIIKDRTEKGDPKLIDQEIQKCTQKIKELKELKKVKPGNEAKINELLEYHAPNFKQNALRRTDDQRYRFIEKAILPNLKRLGYTGTTKDIDDLLMYWGEKK